jgi:putative transposase
MRPASFCSAFNERRPVYRDDRDRMRFVERLAAVVDAHRLRVHAFALVRNHFHLLVETPEANLSRAMGQRNGSYTQDFNRRYRRNGHLFQGRYKAILSKKSPTCWSAAATFISTRCGAAR